MIVGHGDIASVLIDRADRLYFAAGVSNSQETRESEYQREWDLLMAQPKGAHLVYFSSLCVFYSNNRYARHKREMESLVRVRYAVSAIVRLGNITFGTNPHTIINHLRARHAAGLPLDIQDVQRVVHTVDDLRFALALIPAWPCEMPVPGRLLTVRQIVNEFVTWEGALV